MLFPPPPPSFLLAAIHAQIHIQETVFMLLPQHNLINTLHTHTNIKKTSSTLPTLFNHLVPRPRFSSFIKTKPKKKTKHWKNFQHIGLGLKSVSCKKPTSQDWERENRFEATSRCSKISTFCQISPTSSHLFSSGATGWRLCWIMAWSQRFAEQAVKSAVECRTISAGVVMSHHLGNQPRWF